jgi:hypothetical protein
VSLIGPPIRTQARNCIRGDYSPQVGIAAGAGGHAQTVEMIDATRGSPAGVERRWGEEWLATFEGMGTRSTDASPLPAFASRSTAAIRKPILH